MFFKELKNLFYGKVTLYKSKKRMELCLLSNKHAVKVYSMT